MENLKLRIIRSKKEGIEGFMLVGTFRTIPILAVPDGEGDAWV